MQFITLQDNEPAPPPITLQLLRSGSGLFDLTLTGAASRLYDVESSRDLFNWQPFSTLINSNGSVRLRETIQGNQSPLFFRARLVP